jgi:hypothetical protein
LLHPAQHAGHGDTSSTLAAPSGDASKSRLTGKSKRADADDEEEEKPPLRFGLGFQISHKVAALRVLCNAAAANAGDESSAAVEYSEDEGEGYGLKVSSIVLMGHSVGAYICTEIKDDVPKPLAAVFYLFPTLERIVESSNGKRLNVRSVLFYCGFLPHAVQALLANASPAFLIFVSAALLSPGTATCCRIGGSHSGLPAQFPPPSHPEARHGHQSPRRRDHPDALKISFFLAAFPPTHQKISKCFVILNLDFLIV